MPDTKLQEKGITTTQLGRLWDRGLDLPDGDSSRPTRPAEQVEWVYACLRAIITTCRDIQLVFSTRDDKVVESGPIYDLLLNNPDMPWMDFITQTTGFLALHNEVYWIVTETDGLKPKKILIAGRDQCRPVIRNGALVGYELHWGQGRIIPLFLEDVYRVLDFNPYNRHKGMGPLDAAKLQISSSYQATMFNEATLANGARIGVVLTTPQGVKLTTEEMDYLREQFNTQQGGARNAGKAFLATGGMDVKPFTQTMADLQMLDLRRFDATSICAAFGVPPEIIGLNPEAQYAHGPAQLRFIQNTIAPMLSFIAGHITLGLLPRFRFTKHIDVPVRKSLAFCGSRYPLRMRSCFRKEKVKALQSNSQLFAWFDTSQHPAMQAQLEKTAESVLKFTDSGVTLNNLIEAHDLPYETQPWGDEWWIGMGQVPARFALEAGLEGLTGPSLPEGQSPGEEEEGKGSDEQQTKNSELLAAGDEQQRLRIWRNWVISWAGIEREYKEAMRKFFIRQQRILIDKLKKAMPNPKSAKSVVKADPNEIIARVVFDLKIENAKIRVINQVFFEKAGELGIRQSLTEVLSLAGDKLGEAVEQAKRMNIMRASLLRSSHKITKINLTTQNMVARQLESGLNAGEGLNELAARIQTKLGSNRARALSIARTQTGGAVGTGRHTGFKAAGVDKKGWLSSRDNNVRPAHREAESRYAGGIDLDVPFQVGGEFLMYPGDPAGSAANIANCRCAELAVRAAGKAFDPAYYSTLQFYSLHDMQKAKESKDGT